MEKTWVCPLPGALRVLIADDERLASTLVAATLNEAGFAVDRVTDGLEALAALEREHSDILITDWVMPRMDGVSLVSTVRERQEFDELYVIFVTGRDRKSEIVKGLEAGADDYLTKPFDPRELIARARSGARIISLQRSLEDVNRTLEQMAMTDSLTGLPNRRALMDALALEIARLDRGGLRSCLAVLDADNFKRANDVYGHHAGDQVLVALAESVQSDSRGADLAARIGGDEFALLLHDVDLPEAVETCERIRASIQALRIPVGEERFAPTVSFGVAQLLPGAVPADTLAAADSALYRAKELGRNRTIGNDLAA
jgi:diguanylate cyclase (GGDEF)-like protein